MKITKIPSRRPETIIRKKSQLMPGSQPQVTPSFIPGPRLIITKANPLPDWEFAGVFIDDGVTGTKKSVRVR